MIRSWVASSARIRLCRGPNNPQALNRYSYGFNNPLRFTDPSGHDPCDNGGRCYGEPNSGTLGNRSNFAGLSSASFFRVPGYGIFDRKHIGAGINRIRTIRPQVEQAIESGRRGYVNFRFQTQTSEAANDSTLVIARYWVSAKVTQAQFNMVMLGIAMDAERYLEQNQDWGSKYSYEDLPSDYVGYYSEIHGIPVVNVLTQLNGGETPQDMAALPAIALKFSRGGNEEFLPRPWFFHKAWPTWLQMTPIGSDSGLWGHVETTVDPLERTWAQWGQDMYFWAADELSGK